VNYEEDVLSKIPNLPAIVSQIVDFSTYRVLRKSLQVISDRIADALLIPRVRIKLTNKATLKEGKVASGNFRLQRGILFKFCTITMAVKDPHGVKYSGATIFKTACHEWQHWIDAFKLNYINLTQSEYRLRAHSALFYIRCRQLEIKLTQD